MEELALWIRVLLAWNIAGFFFLAILWAESFKFLDDNNILNPCCIYKKFNVNYFGCALLALIFNLLCPLISIVYWLSKIIYFSCTVGRK